jgi:hypothetical protein
MSDIANGTSLQGYVTTTMRDLIAAFGEPTFYYPGEKVTVEWTHTFPNGLVATIYDWKRYDDGVPEMDEVIEYNIGGFTKDVVPYVTVAVLTLDWKKELALKNTKESE